MSIDPVTAGLTVVSKITNIFDKLILDKDLAAKIKADFATLVAQGQINQELAELQAAASIINTEASGNFLQRSWRPILMLSVVAIIVNNYILSPYLQAIFGFHVPLELPSALWELLTWGVGGYVIGRSAEKILPQSKWARGESKDGAEG